MEKILNQRNFDLSRIEKQFKLDEVISKYRQEKRADENGETRTQRDGRPMMFNTDEVIVYKYSVTILDGEFKKKATQIPVDNTECPITSEEIMKRDSVSSQFDDLELLTNIMNHIFSKTKLIYQLFLLKNLTIFKNVIVSCVR